MLDLLAYGATILIWTGTPFITKQLMSSSSISPLNLTLVRWIIGGILSLILIFLFNAGKSLEKTERNVYITLALLSIFSFIASFAHQYLLKKYNADVVSIILNPMMIFLAAIIGNCLYNEPYTPQMWLGTGIIIAGLIVFGSGKKVF
jgi:drug/metabolite transporter (DMT)-like permease